MESWKDKMCKSVLVWFSFSFIISGKSLIVTSPRLIQMLFEIISFTVIQIPTPGSWIKSSLWCLFFLISSKFPAFPRYSHVSWFVYYWCSIAVSFSSTPVSTFFQNSYEFQKVKPVTLLKTNSNQVSGQEGCPASKRVLRFAHR